MEKDTIPENPNDTDAPQRLPNGQFPKGVSGSKFAKRPSHKNTVDDLLDANALKVAKVLIDIILDPNTAGGPRVAAIREFGDRWIGKSTQTTITKRATDENDDLDLSTLDEETLRKIAAAQVKKDD